MDRHIQHPRLILIRLKPEQLASERHRIERILRRHGEPFLPAFNRLISSTTA
jgi:hypothetical protein